MKHALLLLALAAPMVAEQPKSETEAAKERLAVAKILEREFAKPAEQVKQEHREKAAAEVKAYWAEYERRMRAPVAARPAYAPMPAYAPETFEPPAPDSFQHPANKTRQRSTERQSGPYTERSTRLPGGTIQTLTSDGRQCYTERLPGGEFYTYCY